MEAAMVRSGWLDGAGAAARYIFEVADIMGEEAAGICRIMTEYADSAHALSMKAARAWLDAAARFREELREGATRALGAFEEKGKKATVGSEKKA